MDTTLLAWLVLIGSMLLLDFPLFVLGSSRNLSTAELVRLYPQFAWLKQRHRNAIAIIFILIVILTILVLFYESKFEERYFLLLVPFIGARSLFDGILAFTTGVYTFWLSRYGYTHYYDKDRLKYWVSEIQIGLAFALIAASLFLYFA